jgi:hypothetical protein
MKKLLARLVVGSVFDSEVSDVRKWFAGVMLGTTLLGGTACLEAAAVQVPGDILVGSHEYTPVDSPTGQIMAFHDVGAGMCMALAKRVRASADPAVQHLTCAFDVGSVAGVLENATSCDLLVYVHDSQWPSVRQRLYDMVARIKGPGGTIVTFVGVESNQNLP